MRIRGLVLAIILGAAAAGAHAIGLGVQLNLNAGKVFTPGIAVALSLSDTVHLAGNWYFGKNTTSLGLTADVCPLDLPFVYFSGGSLDFTLGAGLFANLTLVQDQDPGFNGGVRVPVGLSLFLGGKTLEIYTHVAPSFGLNLIPSLEISDPFFPIALGVRLWFR